MFDIFGMIFAMSLQLLLELLKVLYDDNERTDEGRLMIVGTFRFASFLHTKMSHSNKNLILIVD